MEITTGLLFGDPPLAGQPVLLVFGGEGVVAPPVVVPSGAEPQTKDLKFSQPQLSGSPTHLVFGDYGAPVEVIPVVEGLLLGILPQPALSSTLKIGPIIPATVSGELPRSALTGAMLVSTISTVTVAGAILQPELAGTLLVSTISLVTIAGAIPQPALVALLDVRQTYLASLAGMLPDTPLVAAMEAQYLTNTARPTIGRAYSMWQVADHGEVGSKDRSQSTVRAPQGVEVAWQPAVKTPLGTGASFSESNRLRVSRDAPFQTGQRRSTDARSVYSDAQRSMRQMLANAFQEAAKAPTSVLRQRHQDGIRYKTSAINGTWQVAVKNRIIGTTGTSSPAMWLIKGWNLEHEDAMRPPAGVYVRPVIVPPKEVCYTPDTNLLFWQTPGSDLVFICEKHGTTPPAPGATVVVPVRKVYMVFNEIALRRVDGNIALPATSMTLGLDVDSWAWSFSAALPGSTLANLEPASSGAPVELEAMVNGAAFRVLVESISRERTFGKNDIRVQGRGKTALLDSPYAPARNFGNTADRTAQQLMADVLSVNGVPMDWALNWGLTDWLVPANVFAHQGSYISALNAIAQAAGGYIQPHASLQSLDVMARYPVAPWNWAAEVTPDFELPADVTTREGIEWAERARYNRVFVSGQQSGVLGQVTRTGTAGDLLAPMVTDALITTAAAARQRGISVLSNTGRQANISLRLPVLPETGIITPGKFVRYTDAGTERLGIVRSVSLDAGFPNVWQSIGVETHV